jgi:circadian clock protein KaiC
VDPAELSPGELIHEVRVAVEERHAAIVVIDSLNGYLNAMPGERFLAIQLHELLAYLSQRNVVTILVSAHQGMLGGPMIATVDATYLADAVILMRFFENRGEIRQAVSIIKKRGGRHERTIREFKLHDGKIFVGDALSEFRGVLTGVPSYEAAGEQGGRSRDD